MRLLAFDCATIRCSAAVWDEGTIRAHVASETPHGATEVLVPMLDRVLAEAAIGLQDVDRLGVTVGPGHFTGLRAGLAVARGLVLATGLPAVAITTLEAVAAATDPTARRNRAVVVAIDSKRAEPYLQIFDEALSPLSAPVAGEIDDFVASHRLPSGILVAGDAGPRLAAALRRAGHDLELARSDPQPDAAVVAALAATRAPVDGPLRPFYLHPPAVKLPAAAPS
ncbi:MAG TPA: tRNA (adenosine(37)-N6)-threonylcarbamoyltransferase complex dimerization subunit type 1 TsaB [Alphaproteobacteria bacterium]|nr:tRNA (adenosine(37)-N6)-threonylcarbamoyltransferase complex dimerization subunit type 1 TsaB [Alphaproteobacteria bacterium]